jgi:hypothetical protein
VADATAAARSCSAATWALNRATSASSSLVAPVPSLAAAFTTARHVTRAARAANRSVDSVSAAAAASGDTAATNAVRALPPNDSASKNVSLESR